MSISRYVAALRCEKVASMLKSGNTSIQEIAAYVGYCIRNKTIDFKSDNCYNK